MIPTYTKCVQQVLRDLGVDSDAEYVVRKRPRDPNIARDLDSDAKYVLPKWFPLVLKILVTFGITFYFLRLFGPKVVIKWVKAKISKIRFR